MTTLIQNEQKRQKIMARMREHLVPVLEHCRGGWVGLFLQGSQNYNLDYEGSDIDTKAIMLPSFSDFVLNAKPLSTTHIMENNEHVDFKDIRLMFDCIKKQNVNFVEILFTPYSIINPEYADLFVYRMTMTNEDGDVVEYPPDFMRYRCEQMGVKCVQVFCRTIIPDFYQLPDDVGSPQAVNAGEYVKKLAENFYDGPDPVGHTHVREGVVCRIVNRPKFAAYKHKNFAFKALEGLIKDTAAAPDMEEAQDVGEQNG